MPSRSAQRRELQRLVRLFALLPAVLLSALAVAAALELAYGDPREVALRSLLPTALALGAVLSFLAARQVRRYSAAQAAAAAEAEARAAALLESEARLRLFVDGVPDAAIFMADADGRVSTWNAGAERLLGQGAAEAVGLDYREFLPDAGVAAERVDADLARTGHAVLSGWRLRGDGRRFWAEVRVALLVDPGGLTLGRAVFMRDATVHKRSEQRRAAQLAAARVLAEAPGFAGALPRLLEVVGRPLEFQVATAWARAGAAYQLAGGWTDDPARYDRLLSEWRDMGLRPDEGAVGRLAVQGGIAWLEELQREPGYLRARSARAAGLVSAVLVAIPAAGETVVVLELLAAERCPRDRALEDTLSAVAIQVGAFVERVRSQEALREVERLRTGELERAVAERTRELTQVNRELEAFSYSVSHDLRAPLRAVDGFSRALAEGAGAGLDAEGQKLVARIRAAARRMGNLIDDLLQLSRASRGELRRQRVDLSALVRELATEAQEREPGRRARWEIAGGVVADGDARLLRVLLANLVDNAFKFSRPAADPTVVFGVDEGASGRAYFVRDNGAGFDPAHAERLFQPFQRLHAPEEFEGTGVGLATVQRIVHRHGGAAWAEGRPGAGACIWFTLGERADAPPGPGR
jgi:PAS domain S-box-containing protein